MKLATTNNDFFQAFKNQNSVTIEGLFQFYNTIEPGLKRATVNWRVYHLVKRGLLKRIGRGIFSLGHEATFRPLADKTVKNIYSKLKKNFHSSPPAYGVLLQ